MHCWKIERKEGNAVRKGKNEQNKQIENGSKKRKDGREQKQNLIEKERSN